MVFAHVGANRPLTLPPESAAHSRVLLVTANLAEKKGGTLQLSGARPEIREVILTVGFDDIVHLRD